MTISFQMKDGVLVFFAHRRFGNLFPYLIRKSLARGESVSVRNLHAKFIRLAWLKSFAFLNPRPPCFLSRQRTSHLIKCIFFFSLFPCQKNSLQDLSIRLQIETGNLKNRGEGGFNKHSSSCLRESSGFPSSKKAGILQKETH